MADPDMLRYGTYSPRGIHFEILSIAFDHEHQGHTCGFAPTPDSACGEPNEWKMKSAEGNGVITWITREAFARHLLSRTPIASMEGLLKKLKKELSHLGRVQFLSSISRSVDGLREVKAWREKQGRATDDLAPIDTHRSGRPLNYWRLNGMPPWHSPVKSKSKKPDEYDEFYRLGRENALRSLVALRDYANVKLGESVKWDLSIVYSDFVGTMIDAAKYQTAFRWLTDREVASIGAIESWRRRDRRVLIPPQTRKPRLTDPDW